MKNKLFFLEFSVKSRANESVPESFFYIYSVMKTRCAVLTFESVDKLIQIQMKPIQQYVFFLFGIFHEFCLLALLGVKGLMKLLSHVDLEVAMSSDMTSLSGHFQYLL